MLLSIVTGTFQRLDYLRAMVESVRRQLPIGMTYEFVIVDAGSKDGTVEWAAQQNDIHFIQQGELLGAIKAFDAGCEAAQGEYVLLLNDDVLVLDSAIIKALVHLETHPNCGAVAFGDKRPDGTKSGKYYEVGNLYGILPNGMPTGMHYAQCGLFRKWLGDACGWWGSRDKQFQPSHTYGGDNRLSAEIWMRGYTVDAVTGCAVDDRVAPDGLRERNHQQEKNIGSAYMRIYGNGVKINSLPKPENPQAERMRILYLPLFSPGYGRYKTGLFDALSNVGLVYEVDYVSNRAKVTSAVKDFQPHLILTQFHDANTIPPSALEALRTYAPGAVVVNWDGDVYMDQLTSPDMLELLKHVDLQLVVNADVLPIYAEQGIKAAYWQIGYEPVSNDLPSMPEHDILFMANAYSPARKELGAVLKELSHNVGIYGTGWGGLGSGNTFYKFDLGASLYRRCKIAVGDNQYGDKGFVSNRLFEALANGAFMLHQAIPGMEELTGLVDGVHYVSWTDYEDLGAKARSYLFNDAERQKIAAAGEAFVREHHSFDARVRELFEELLPRIEHGRSDERFETMADFVAEYGGADGIPR